jgi:hypothetical protein
MMIAAAIDLIPLLRFAHPLMATACLSLIFASAAQSQSTNSNARSAPAPAEAGQTAPPAQQQPAPSAAPQSKAQSRFPSQIITREDTYRDFIIDTGLSDENQRWDIAHGRPGRKRYSICVGISVAAELTIYSIVPDAFRRYEQSSDPIRKAVGSARQLTPDQAMTVYKLSLISDQQQEEIVQETMARLKQALTKEDIDKLDAYIYERGGGGKELTTKNMDDSHRADRCSVPFPAPAVQQQQGVQP